MKKWAQLLRQKKTRNLLAIKGKEKVTDVDGRIALQAEYAVTVGADAEPVRPYWLNSPRKGDDGAPVAIGRPWHNYPKVAILNSEMCEQMHPEGWPTTWRMEYAATSDKLHLYEYNNIGKGADMSRRAKWAGLRALTSQEAADYTMEKVLGDWNPEKSK